MYVDPLYPKPVGLVVPVEKSLRSLAANNGIHIEDWEQLCADHRVRKLVLDMLHTQAKQSGLKGAELLHDIWLCKDLWTTEMGLLTPAQKIKRREISETYAAELKDMISSQKQ